MASGEAKTAFVLVAYIVGLVAGVICAIVGWTTKNTPLGLGGAITFGVLTGIVIVCKVSYWIVSLCLGNRQKTPQQPQQVNHVYARHHNPVYAPPSAWVQHQNPVYAPPSAWVQHQNPVYAPPSAWVQHQNPVYAPRLTAPAPAALAPLA